jgi:hypothetical protein
MAMAKGILLAVMNFARIAEDEFHDWYDTEHLPERQRLPGFLLCHRWIGADDRRISLSYCDLATLAALKTPEYLAIVGDNLSPWSKRMSQVERLMRFAGEQIPPGDQLSPEGAGGLVLNATNVDPGAEAEFNEWYDQERIRAVAAVPGVLCARRFRASDADLRYADRRYVALYHLVSPEVQATAAWKSATDTEWAGRLRPHFRDHLRLVCRKYVRGR